MAWVRERAKETARGVLESENYVERQRQISMSTVWDDCFTAFCKQKKYRSEAALCVELQSETPEIAVDKIISHQGPF